MSSTLVPMQERICWTRMQTEAGEGLARIVRRKELERRTGNGLFFWGVGNAPSRAIPALARAAVEIDVLFSVMKSKPKAQDVTPSRLLAWNSYVDIGGVVRSIPSNVLITSRASSRACHYALMCHSETPLAVADGGPFDPAAFRNYGAGGAVGPSQVTALLERWTSDGSTDYRVAMRAELTGGMWVKLVNPVEVSGAARAALMEDLDDEREWLALVARVRAGGPLASSLRHHTQPLLFAI